MDAQHIHQNHPETSHNHPGSSLDYARNPATFLPGPTVPTVNTPTLNWVLDLDLQYNLDLLEERTTVTGKPSQVIQPDIVLKRSRFLPNGTIDGCDCGDGIDPEIIDLIDELIDIHLQREIEAGVSDDELIESAIEQVEMHEIEKDEYGQ